MISTELILQHGKTIMSPPVVDGVSIEWERKGQPGKLSFEVIKTDSLFFDEGDSCRFSVGDKHMFYGFVFDKSRSGAKSESIKVTVYDQLYYFKNKTYFEYSNLTADGVTSRLAKDFGLNIGTLENTGFIIPSRLEENKSIFDITSSALDLTLSNNGQMYVIYDDAGKLMLKSIGNMKLNTVIDRDTAGDFDYKTSISDEVYNAVVLYRDGQEPVAVYDEANIKKWGMLQYCEKVSEKNVNLGQMANSLLSLYNTKKRTLSVKNVLGDVRVRGGSMVPVILSLGDIEVSSYLLVEQVKHTFKDNEHFMELKLRGGNFVA